MLSTRFTVLFVPPFWEGILERQDGRRYETARVVFGAEPTEQEVWEFVLHRLPRLPTGSRIQTAEAAPRIRNPKRLQRSIAREQRNAVGKKAWAALAASREEQKARLRSRTAEQRRQQEQEKFQKRTAKRREKHRGH